MVACNGSRLGDGRHLSIKVEAIPNAKYSEKDDFIAKALLALNRC